MANTCIACREARRGRKILAERLIHAVRMQAKRGKIAIAGKERGSIVWAGDVAAQ
jgi:hypothetical protein